MLQHTLCERTQVEQIRILLAVHPRMLREVLTGLLAQAPDIEVVGQVDDPVELLVAVQQSEANVVVMASKSGEMPPVCSHLFCEYPGLLVVVIATDTDQAQVYRQEIVARPVVADTAHDLMTSLELLRDDCM